MRQSRIRTLLLILIMLYPWMVSYAPIDSLGSEIAISLGAGEEVRISRDCSGNVLRKDALPYTNVAASYSEQVDKHVTVKVAAGGGSLRDDGSFYVPKGLFAFEHSQREDVLVDSAGPAFERHSYFYVAPRVSFHWRYLGVQLGAVMNTGFDYGELPVMPIVALRIGSERGFAVHLSSLEHDLILGPGWFYGGCSIAIPLSAPRDSYLRFKLGATTGPDEDGGIRIDAEFPIEQIVVAPSVSIMGEGNAVFGTVRYRF